jgi:hypothetical protein
MPPRGPAMDGRAEGSRRAERPERPADEAGGRAEARKAVATGGPRGRGITPRGLLSRRPPCGGAMDGPRKTGEPRRASTASETGFHHELLLTPTLPRESTRLSAELSGAAGLERLWSGWPSSGRVGFRVAVLEWRSTSGVGLGRREFRSEVRLEANRWGGGRLVRSGAWWVGDRRRSSLDLPPQSSL